MNWYKNANLFSLPFFTHNTVCSQWRNWRGGKCPPGSSDVGPFLEMGLLNSAFFAF